MAEGDEEQVHEKISIKTMTDYHLYDFMRCPHKFYFRHIKEENLLHLNGNK